MHWAIIEVCRKTASRDVSLWDGDHPHHNGLAGIFGVWKTVAAFDCSLREGSQYKSMWSGPGKSQERKGAVGSELPIPDESGDKTCFSGLR